MNAAFIFFSPHPMHAEFAKAVGIKERDWYSFKPIFFHPWLTPMNALLKAVSMPRYDLYLVEGGGTLTVAAFKRIFSRGRSKVVQIGGDPFFRLGDVSKLGQIFRKFLMNEIDGVIAVSKLVEEDVRKHINVPVKVVPPFVANMNKFLGLKSNFGTKNIVFAGDYAGISKGTDLLVEAFKIIKKTEPEARLYLLGRWMPREFSEVEGIAVVGWADPAEYFPKCTFYVNPARYDAFSISVIEACLAGLIPIVSSTTGAKEFIEKVDPTLVIDSLSPEDIAAKILEVMNRGEKEFKRISEKLRKIARVYERKRCLVLFKKAFEELIQEIEV